MEQTGYKFSVKNILSKIFEQTNDFVIYKEIIMGIYEVCDKFGVDKARLNAIIFAFACDIDGIYDGAFPKPSTYTKLPTTLKQVKENQLMYTDFITEYSIQPDDVGLVDYEQGIEVYGSVLNTLKIVIFDDLRNTILRAYIIDKQYTLVNIVNHLQSTGKKTRELIVSLLNELNIFIKYKHVVMRILEYKRELIGQFIQLLTYRKDFRNEIIIGTTCDISKIRNTDTIPIINNTNDGLITKIYNMFIVLNPRNDIACISEGIKYIFALTGWNNIKHIDKEFLIDLCVEYNIISNGCAQFILSLFPKTTKCIDNLSFYECDCSKLLNCDGGITVCEDNPDYVHIKDKYNCINTNNLSGGNYKQKYMKYKKKYLFEKTHTNS